MKNIPIWLDIAFIAITLASVLLLAKAAHRSRPLLVACTLWGVLIGALAFTGFYADTSGMPPLFAMVIGVPLLSIILLFLTPAGRQFIDGMDGATLTLLHVVRVPVELALYGLFIHGAVPELMTFSGVNFDVLSGLSAPLVWWFGYKRAVLPHWSLIAWNVACLGLLANVVGNAVLAAPFDFQTQAFDEPNIAILYAPFVWLPGIVVPIVLLSHLIMLRRLLRV